MCFVFQAVPKAKGQALADEYGMKFFETVRCGSKFCYLYGLNIFVWLINVDEFDFAECQD